MDELNALDLSQSMAKMEEDHEENLKCKVKELNRCKVREILIQTKKVRCFMNQDTAL